MPRYQSIYKLKYVSDHLVIYLSGCPVILGYKIFRILRFGQLLFLFFALNYINDNHENFPRVTGNFARHTRSVYMLSRRAVGFQMWEVLACWFRVDLGYIADNKRAMLLYAFVSVKKRFPALLPVAYIRAWLSAFLSYHQNFSLWIPSRKLAKGSAHLFRRRQISAYHAHIIQGGKTS